MNLPPPAHVSRRSVAGADNYHMYHMRRAGSYRYIKRMRSQINAKLTVMISAGKPFFRK